MTESPAIVALAIAVGYPVRYSSRFTALCGGALLVIIIGLWSCYDAASRRRCRRCHNDNYRESLCADPEPASQRACRVPVVRLRAPPLSRVVVLFTARSVAEQRIDPHRGTRGA